MPNFVTPARLAALVGVLTGLGAAVTSALNVIPHDTSIGRALVASVGVLGTVGSIAKFLEGQAGWEQQQSAQAHALALSAQEHAQRTALYHDEPVVLSMHPPEATAVLPDETPLESADEAGTVVDTEAPSGEPQRLVDQAS